MPEATSTGSEREPMRSEITTDDGVMTFELYRGDRRELRIVGLEDDVIGVLEQAKKRLRDNGVPIDN
jgi:hypothetical protein